MNVTITEFKERALADLKGNWKEPVLAALILFLITVVVEGIANSSKNMALISTSRILAILVLMPIAYGFTLAILGFIRGDKNGLIDKMFCCFRNYGRSLGVTFMVMLWTFLWSLLFIVPGIIKAISYSMTYYISNDHPEYTVDQCIEESKRMMNGHKWFYFVMCLSFIGWFLLTIITLGIGNLWLTPYMSATQAHFYEELKKENTIN